MIIRVAQGFECRFGAEEKIKRNLLYSAAWKKKNLWELPREQYHKLDFSVLNNVNKSKRKNPMQNYACALKVAIEYDAGLVGFIQCFTCVECVCVRFLSPFMQRKTAESKKLV